MAADNNGFHNMLKQLVHYYPSYYYPFQYFYVQPQQKQQAWHSYFPEKQQQQQQQQQVCEEELRMEEIKRNIFDLLNDDPVTEVVDRRLVSFLETDNSFLTPWSWNPDGLVDHGSSSTTGRIKIVPGSFFSDILVFLSEDEKSKYLSGTNAELVYDDSSDQTSDHSLDQTSNNFVGQTSDGSVVSPKK